jgi:hypothetical protein
MRNQLKADLVIRDEDFEIDWKAALEMVDRREAAAKQVVPCEKCSSMQVQLVDWSSDILKMKCRTCKHKFERTLK